MQAVAGTNRSGLSVATMIKSTSARLIPCLDDRPFRSHDAEIGCCLGRAGDMAFLDARHGLNIFLAGIYFFGQVAICQHRLRDAGAYAGNMDAGFFVSHFIFPLSVESVNHAPFMSLELSRDPI